jgi:predicted amidophosphoribosyltransferase
MSMIEKGLNLLLPHRCPLCRRQGGDRGLCGACWRRLSFIDTPFCQCCGRPLPHALPHDVCAGCHIAPPPLATARAAFVYDDGSRQLLLRFKHGDGLHLTPLLTLFLRPHFDQFAASSPLVVPIPLHPTRYLKRRYNQAA